MGFFGSGDQIQNFFWPKRIKTMSLSVFEPRQMVEKKGFGVWTFDDKFPVDIQGTSDETYFNGKQVCAILRYTDSTKTLWEHLDDDEKKTLSGLITNSVINCD